MPAIQYRVGRQPHRDHDGGGADIDQGAGRQVAGAKSRAIWRMRVTNSTSQGSSACEAKRSYSSAGRRFFNNMDMCSSCLALEEDSALDYQVCRAHFLSYSQPTGTVANNVRAALLLTPNAGRSRRSMACATMAATRPHRPRPTLQRACVTPSAIAST